VGAARLAAAAEVAGMLAFVTLCGLAFVAALLAVTGGAHLLAPAAFGRTLRRHGLLPGALAAPAALALAVGELALAGAAALALAGRFPAPAVFAVALVLGLAFLVYLRSLARTGHTGSCGCTPLDAPLTPASFAPAAALAVTGALGLAATAVGGSLAPAADAWSALAAAWGLTLAALVLLLPASAPGTAVAGEAAAEEGVR